MFEWLKKKGAKPVAQPLAGASAQDKGTHKRTQAELAQASAEAKRRGNALLEEGKVEEAAACYREAVKADDCNADAWLSLGYALSELKRSGEAQEALSRALALDGKMADAYYLLGAMARERGDANEAIHQWSRALEVQPEFEIIYRDLCQLLFQSGQAQRAMEVILKGISLYPQQADFYYYRGNLEAHRKAYDKAIDCYRTALKINPDYTEVHNNLGEAYRNQGELDAAVRSYRAALECKQDFVEAHSKLGLVLQEQGKLEAAIECYRKALSLTPDAAEVLNNLGLALQAQGQLEEAVRCHQRAIALKPDHASAHNNLANAFQTLGKLSEAIGSYRMALSLHPDYAEAHSNLAGALQAAGDLDAAIEGYKQALLLKPDFQQGYSNLLFVLNYHPDRNAEEIVAAYRDFDQRFCLSHRPVRLDYPNDREPTRRLKVGYVSPDFRHHSVRNFLEPLLAHHDKNAVEVYAYAELTREDAMTARYRTYADHWIPTLGMTDAALAERVRSDRIDILIDLAGHTAQNRLQVFARKPAPVSVSWLGYGYTTGLSAIDYLLTDDTSAPAGCEDLFSEAPWRLKTPAFAYRPTEGMGATSGLPAQSRGWVTFGTLTRAIRLNHRTIRVWSEILKRVPNSRLVIDSGNFKDAAMQTALAERFAAHGVDRGRLEIGFHSPPWDVLRGLDIGLDCFPHNSGTTLFETLYMGVPYITLAGRPSVGRLGSSILTGLGYPEWIAQTEQEYVEKAVALATDLPALAALRAGLRKRMEASPLMDEAGFAARVEQAYREMWKKWCG